MMRAALIVASVSTLSAMEIATPPRSVKAVDEPVIQSNVGIDISRDTLTKADRLEFPYMLNEAPRRPISMGRMLSANSTIIDSAKAPKIISRRWDESKKVAVALPKPIPKTKYSKEAKNLDPSKARTEFIKPCLANAFHSFLRALNLSSGCQT